MATAEDFRRIALGLHDTIESAHMGHPDFRHGGRIFATLHADMQWGMVYLTPDQQADMLRAHPGAFTPEPGAWGRNGCTAVKLAAANDELLGEVLTLAKRHVAAKKKKSGAPPPRRRG